MSNMALLEAHQCFSYCFTNVIQQKHRHASHVDSGKYPSGKLFPRPYLIALTFTPPSPTIRSLSSTEHARELFSPRQNSSPPLTRKLQRKFKPKALSTRSKSKSISHSPTSPQQLNMAPVHSACPKCSSPISGEGKKCGACGAVSNSYLSSKAER